jgi:4-amino-4-deoxy-L-arabinose transferase-like glycosyltransferase
MPSERRDWIAALALIALSAALLLPNLGNGFLWQDEAQTAAVARTILSDGVPRGSDGVNFFSQEQGREYGPNYIWKWHTWLSFYLAAASFLVLGETTFAARLPFALFGVATVVLCYFAGPACWRCPCPS